VSRMKTAKRLDEFILAALTPQERLEAALKLARAVFRDSTLSMEDLEAAIQKVRRHIYERQAKGRGGH
jgi:hypothetical protein